MEAGQPTGTWVYYYDNGRVESTGILAGEEKIGQWKYYTRSGRLLEAVNHDELAAE